MVRKITADIVYPVSHEPIPQGVVVVDEKGAIHAIGPREDFKADELEMYEGALVPGFINAHCHLELSFMKGAIPEHTGLIEFVKQVVAIRDEYSEEEQQKAIQQAADQMRENGIVAVGDISNDTRSFRIKEQSGLRFHTFVEVFDLGPGGTAGAKTIGLETYQKAPRIFGSSASITQHAPYSVTRELFDFCDQHTRDNGRILSIHNQEEEDENKLFQNHSGDWLNLFEGWELSTDWIPQSGQTSLCTYLPWVSPKNRLLLVHNIHTTKEEVDFAHERHPDVWWCFNPNANLYIENRLPDYRNFKAHWDRCVIGTDSLASNHQLNILEEIKTILSQVDYLSFDQLLRWATINGAQLLRFQGTMGSLEPGKIPGINLLSGISNGHLSMEAEVNKLI